MTGLDIFEGYHPIFSFIQGYVGDSDHLPDGAWHQLHVEAVEQYNKLEKTEYDFFDFQFDYFTWLQVKGIK